MDSLALKIDILTNNALKFVLNNEIKTLKKDPLGLYVFNGVNEHAIRPPAQTVLALGVALSIDIYDEEIVGNLVRTLFS